MAMPRVEFADGTSAAGENVIDSAGDAGSLSGSNLTYVVSKRRWRLRVNPVQQSQRIRILKSADIELLDRVVWESHREVLVSIGRRGRPRSTQRLLDEVMDWCAKHRIGALPTGVSVSSENDQILLVSALFGRAPFDYILKCPPGSDFKNVPSNLVDEPRPSAGTEQANLSRTISDDR